MVGRVNHYKTERRTKHFKSQTCLKMQSYSLLGYFLQNQKFRYRPPHHYAFSKLIVIWPHHFFPFLFFNSLPSHVLILKASPRWNSRHDCEVLLRVLFSLPRMILPWLHSAFFSKQLECHLFRWNLSQLPHRVTKTNQISNPLGGNLSIFLSPWREVL